MKRLALLFCLLAGPAFAQLGLPAGIGQIGPRAIASTCPRGIAFADGCAAASTNSPQLPALLSGYVTRPPWNVPGVDYAVGPNAGCPTNAWQTLVRPGVAVNTGASPPNVTVTAPNVVLNCIDFSNTSSSGGNGAVVNVLGSANVSITNSKFGGSNMNATLTGIINFDTSSPGGIVKWNTLNGSGTYLTNQSTLVSAYNCNGIVVQYNDMLNMAQHALECNNSSGLANPDYRFNLIRDGGLGVLSHDNVLQSAGGTFTPLMTFDTIVQQNNPYQPSERVQTYGFLAGSTITNPNTSNLTIVAAVVTAGGTWSMSGSTLTASSFSSGSFVVGMTIAGSGVAGGTTISSCTSPTVCQISPSQTLSARSMTGSGPSVSFVFHFWNVGGVTKVGTLTATDIYSDSSGTYGLCYPGSATGGTTVFGNEVNMVTGAVSPNLGC